jgi:hypothetical protein
VNTRPLSCHSSPAASRSTAWAARRSRSALSAISGSFSVRRDRFVLVSPEVEVVPAQRPCLLGPDPGHQQQHHVCVQPIGLSIRAASLPFAAKPASRGVDERPCLIHRQRLGRPHLTPGRRPDQRGHVPADQIVGLGVADRSHQAVVRDLRRTCGQLLTQPRQRRTDIRGRQLAQRPVPEPIRQRPDTVPVQLDGPR